MVVAAAGAAGLLSGHIDRYNYVPSLPAAIVLAVLFTIAALITTFQWIKYRAWVWLIMVLAVWMESGGYIVRAVSTQNTFDKSIFIAQYSLVVLAPVMMAAACYIIFGRIVYHVVPKAERTMKLLLISPRFVTPIFVVCDIVALLLQLAGVVKITSLDPTDPDIVSKAKKGKKIALIGVGVQIACFGLFCIIAIRFNFTAKRFEKDFQDRTTVVEGSEKYVVVDGRERKLKKNWQALLHAINIASLLIMVRTIYRTVDFSLGRTGYTEEHEWGAYVFDALPIFVCVLLFNWWHPAKYLPYLGIRVPKHAR